jgi:hypothetical protein
MFGIVKGMPWGIQTGKFRLMAFGLSLEYF